MPEFADPAWPESSLTFFLVAWTLPEIPAALLLPPKVFAVFAAIFRNMRQHTRGSSKRKRSIQEEGAC